MGVSEHCLNDAADDEGSSVAGGGWRKMASRSSGND